MSATLDDEKLKAYFLSPNAGSNQMPPHLAVPGRMFPVEEFYLEDVIENCDYGAGGNDVAHQYCRWRERWDDYEEDENVPKEIVIFMGFPVMVFRVMVLLSIPIGIFLCCISL